MDDDLVTFLTRELASRGWTYRELARRAGISHSTVSNVMAGLRQPTDGFCTAIGRALGQSPEVLMRMAGILPRISDEDRLSIQELVEIVRRLPRERLKDVINYALFRSRYPFPPSSSDAASERSRATNETES